MPAGKRKFRLTSDRERRRQLSPDGAELHVGERIGLGDFLLSQELEELPERVNLARHVSVFGAARF